MILLRFQFYYGSEQNFDLNAPCAILEEENMEYVTNKVLAQFIVIIIYQ